MESSGHEHNGVRRRKKSNRECNGFASEAADSESTEQKPVLLANQSPAKRWKSWSQRTLWTIVLVASFMAIVLSGPLYITILVMVLQVLCFHEIVGTASKANRMVVEPGGERHRPIFFTTLSWYFLFCANFFLYGKHIARHLHDLLPDWSLFLRLSQLKGYHNFISFSLYTAGLMAFVLTLRPGLARKQFSQFGWTHVTCLIVVTCSRFMVNNLFEGLAWFLIPVLIIICNDICAYICGFFFGRTPLIKVSPKKTWEGFIGALVATTIFGFMLPYYWAPYDYFRCPVVAVSFKPTVGSMTCVTPAAFVLEDYRVPAYLHWLLPSTLRLYPVQLHSLIFALFGSLIAPFGGFLASGFKRAFKVKDFGDSIPGHGGFTDRFDCQFLMAGFTFVYLQSFVQGGTSRVSFDKIIDSVLEMSAERKLELFNLLKGQLVVDGVLPPA